MSSLPPVEALTARRTLTVPEAAAILGISRNKAYEAVARDEIPHVRLGSRIVVPTARLLSLLGETTDASASA